MCGCTDEQSQLNCVISALHVLVDTAAEAAAWVSDVLLHRRDVVRLLQHLISDCSTAADLHTDTEVTTHDHKLLTTLMSDSQKILTVLMS